MKKFLRKIKIRIPSKKIRRLIYSFFYISYGSRTPFSLESISSVKIYISINGYLVVTVTTYKPGLLIGEHGYTINKLEKFIQKECKFLQVYVIAKQCNLWHFQGLKRK